MNFIDYLETNLTTSRASGGSQIVIHDDCPFCGATGGRIYVDVKKQVGIDHKCGEGFGAIKFVMAHEDVPGWKARELLGGSADRFVSEEDEPEAGPGRWWPQCVGVAESQEAMEYMERRGFDLAFCLRMGFSFCPANTLVDGKTHYTANRVIIPVFDRECRPISWQGRDITGESWMKYLIQPGFDAGESLYNIQVIAEGEPVIVVEGVMDAWGWIRAGFTNVVATWGKKISNEQVLLLAGVNPSLIYMAWDGDAAAKKYEFAEKYGHLFDVRIVEMADLDADELDSGTLRRLLQDASLYSWEAKIMAALKT